jgi:hypothetical protein
VRKGNRSAQKIVKNWLTRFKNTKIEIWHYILDWWKPQLTKKIEFEEKKSKIRCLWSQLNFIEGLIEL